MPPDKVTEVTPRLVPNGGMREVSHSLMLFRPPKALDKDIKAGNGYDNHFVLSMKKPNKVVYSACIMNPKSGRFMKVWPDKPGIQIYS